MTEPGAPRSRRRPFAIVAVLVGVAVAVAVAVTQTRKSEPAPPPAAAAPPAAAPATPAVAAPSRADAFAAVYPHPDQKVAWQGKTYDVRFTPHAVYPLGGDVFALVSLGRNRDDFHAAKGFYSVAYVKGAPPSKAGEPFVASASAGGDGQPPEVTLSTRLSSAPTLLVQSSFMAQGDESRWVDLVRLGERPSVVAERIPVLEDNSGAFADPKDPEVSKTAGRIKAGVKDEAFAVIYQGSWNGAVVWRWDGARWRCTGEKMCPAARP